MSETITLPDGRSVTLVQAKELAQLIERADRGTTHWHFNDCGCCVTLHGPDYAYVINSDGDSTLYPGRGCKCE